jgi:hypothetical protein
MAVTEPVAPFDATVAGVIALLPQASFPDVLAVGQKAVTKTDIYGYVEDVTGQVRLRIADYTRLKEELQPIVTAAARDIVHNGAGAYTQDARFPEKSGKTRDSYAEVLWTRYQEGLAQLEKQVAAWLRDEDKATPDGGGSGPGWCFPPPAITENTGF